MKLFFIVFFFFNLTQIFCIYMLIIAFAYFLYLFADIRYHIYRAKNQFKECIQRTQHIEKFMEKERAIDSENQVSCIYFMILILHIFSFILYNLRKTSTQRKFCTQLNFEIPVTQFKCTSSDGASFNWKASSSSEASYSQALNLPSPETIQHRYCFISGRNGSSLYVKLGASCELRFIASSQAISINYILCISHHFNRTYTFHLLFVVYKILLSLQGLHLVYLCTQHFASATIHSSYLRMELNCMNVHHF